MFGLYPNGLLFHFGYAILGTLHRIPNTEHCSVLYTINGNVTTMEVATVLEVRVVNPINEAM